MRKGTKLARKSERGLSGNGRTLRGSQFIFTYLSKKSWPGNL